MPLRSYENIDKDVSLNVKEKEYLKSLHRRSKKGSFSRRPSENDYEKLVLAYGKNYSFSYFNMLAAVVYNYMHIFLFLGGLIKPKMIHSTHQNMPCESYVYTLYS